MGQIKKGYIALGIGLAFAFVVVVLFVLIAVLGVSPNSGSFAGFGERGYRSLDPGISVHPLVEFYYKNRELRKQVETGVAQIESVYITYKSFVNAQGLEQVPKAIMLEAAKMVSFMEDGRDFTIPDTNDFKSLGMAIISMDRLLVSYLDSLKVSKDKLGGTDPAQERIHQDYMRVGSLGTGYIDNVLNNIDIDGMYGDDTKGAERVKADIREQIGIQLQMGQSDPLRYAESDYSYQNSLNDGMSTKGMISAREKYKDRRFPGTFERRQILDEPVYKPEKDYKDPNVPRPGIIGKIADVPYHYDIYAKNYIRSF